ncbi:Cas10/Cmr2 second palm domain-containing protein [Oceanivirga salmonicida]|uniref:Cas10/Cmr2 second palm domain-containing protein n=1 Tax=Oceanivirga salmonicida TaxID=1769291 RepID=UPI0012E0D697|nr:hypothetical protein [Oceanivirga salmonicida]
MYIMSVETVKIKDFLFSTNKLKCIRGASYLLDYLNTYGIRKILDKYKIKNTKINKEFLDNILSRENGNISVIDTLYSKLKDDDLIYIAAGNAKFFIKNKIDVENIKEEIELMYKYLAPGCKIVISYEEIKENEQCSDVVYKLSKNVNIKKNLGFDVLNFDLPFIKKCDLSGDSLADVSKDDILSKESIKKVIYPNKIGNKKYVFENILDEIILKIDESKLKNQIFNLIGNETEFYISRETLIKIIMSNFIKEKSEENSFYSLIINEFENINLDTTISDYSKNEDKSYVGFMYSDGDGIGNFIKNESNNKSNEEYLKFIKSFSILLDYVTKISLIEALKEIKNETEKIIGEFLIVGGDDVCALFEPKIALQVSLRYQQIFEEKMKMIKFENITASNGLIIVKNKVPIYLMFKQSLILQKNAKQKKYANNNKSGYIDFENISSSGNAIIEKYRKGKETSSKRPYEIHEFEDLVHTIETLKKKYEEFPKNKLRKIYEIKIDENEINQDKNMLILNYLFKTNVDINKIWPEIKDLSVFDDKTICNDILDIIDLYDFV